MTFRTFYFKLINRIPSLKKRFQSKVKSQLTNEKLLIKLNQSYTKFTWEERVVYHALCAKMFRKKTDIQIDSQWKVNFGMATIELPLTTESLWLNWDTALSIIGHDIEVKRFYQKLLQSDIEINHFFDVGANYGTHSLLMASNGVKVTSFEPNPSCNKTASELFDLNTVKVNQLAIGLGNKDEKAFLQFEQSETWNGTVLSEADEDTIPIEIKKLDDISKEFNITPKLIKIDTEGFEIKVLEGAQDLLKQQQSIIIFESLNDKNRTSIWKLFEAVQTPIYDLDNALIRLNQHSFIQSDSTNFVAIPDEYYTLLKN